MISGRDQWGPRRRNGKHLVVASEAVDAALHENEAELAVLVLPEAVEMLAHGHGLLDEEVQVLGDLGGKAW